MRCFKTLMSINYDGDNEKEGKGVGEGGNGRGGEETAMRCAMGDIAETTTRVSRRGASFHSP